jgi:lysophospholipase L1-like esterase
MNINPNARRVLCFGDSNTWGYVPGTKSERYPVNIRWTGVLQKLLGDNFEVIEEGLNSRGIVKGDSRPGKEQRSAMEYILACLDSHDPLDFVVVCLGANELKAEFNLSAEEVGKNLEKLIQTITTRPSQFRSIVPQVIIIVPAIINELTDYAKKDGKFVGAMQKSIELKEVLSLVARENNCVLVDVQDQLSTGVDGVHLLVESHQILSEAVSAVIVSH